MPAPRILAFTLVEVVIAIGLIAFSLVAILSLLPVAMNASRDSISDTRASLIVQDTSSRVSNLFTNSTLTLPFSTNFYYNSEGIEEANISDQQFLATLTVEALAPAEYAARNLSTNELISATVSIRSPLINGVVPAGVTNQRPTVFTWYVNRR